MDVTLDISNYPLDQQYEDKIIDFIERFKTHGFDIHVTATSTLIAGDYDEVMRALNEEIKTSFGKYGKMIFVVKILNGRLDVNFEM